MTLAEIAESEEMRGQIKIALEHPALEIAFRALEMENMPELVIKGVPGLDIMDSIALDAAKRAGAQSVLKRLRRLPYLTSNALTKARQVGGSWEYLEPETSPDKPTKPKKST